MKALNSIIGALVVVSATAFSAPTQAVMVSRIQVSSAVAGCHGTTATFDDMLKVSYQGMRNASANKMAIINCGGVATPNNSGTGDVVVYEIGLDNRGATDITLNCSLYDGLADSITGVATVYPKSVTVPAGSAAYIDWDGTDTGGTQWDNGAKFSYPSVECQLPTNMELSYTAQIYNVDVGS